MNTNTKNSVTLTGNLGSAPEINDLANGGRLAKVSIAINEKFNSEGKEVEKTNWFNLIFWNDNVNLISEFQKGDFVEIKGKLTVNDYTDKEGGRRTSVEIVVFEVKKIEKAA